jgi:hypothetical protein
MGAEKNRIAAVLIALVMVMTSVVGVFATEASVAAGSNQYNTSVANVARGTIKVNTDGKVLSAKPGTVSGNTITGLKEGDKVAFTTTEGTSYRWIKSTKITKAKKKNLKWKKVKGATHYVVRIAKKNGTVKYKRVKGTSMKKGLAKGDKVRVRPIYKSKTGKVYVGVFCKARKIK